MKNLRRNFERFCYRNRNKGIPDLMLYIVIGCGVVSALTLLGFTGLYNILCFDRALILQGQVWRLVTYVFCLSGSNLLMTLITLYCTYSLGRAVESRWGTCKFNLYYLGGILLMDLYAMIFDGHTWFFDFATKSFAYIPAGVSGYYAAFMPYFLHLSLVLCFATMYPESRFVVFFVIPIKAKLLSLFYLAYTLFQVIQFTVPTALLPHNLFPLVALLNYFLFFGKDVLDLLPLSWQAKLRRKPNPKPAAPTGSREPIHFRPKKAEAPQGNFTHRCTVCGRTDVSHPDLEFRYCSRCQGYHCYCQDHISNHTHIQ